MRRYIPVDQSNRNRIWPLPARSGEIVHVCSDKITETDEDLSAWIESGLITEIKSPAKPESKPKAKPKAKAEVEPDVAPTRAHNEDGTFRSDDPSTPDVNEAFKATPEPKKATPKQRLSKARNKKKS